MVVQCCVCKKIRQADGSWRHQAIPAGEENYVSHSYCPECFEPIMAEFRSEKKQSAE